MAREHLARRSLQKYRDFEPLLRVCLADRAGSRQWLAFAACWDLPLPLAVRGATISATALAASPPGCYDGPEPGTRALTLQTPLANGLDVRLLQLGLSDSGADIEADGVFGRKTFEQLKDDQLAQGLPATGAADPALVLRLATYPPV